MGSFHFCMRDLESSIVVLALGRWVLASGFARREDT
jgi:hypothetical protein